ncbi:MAG: hypothetical protein ACRDT4_04210 [Micromonosporaceae bacterium]
MASTSRLLRIAVLATGLGIATLAVAPAAPAAADGDRCDGAQVRTCVSFVRDGDYRFKPKAVITDVAGDGRDFRVRVTNLYLEQKRGDQWVRAEGFGVVHDYDGWHDAQDVVIPANWQYCSYVSGSITLRARATFTWDNFGTGETTESGTSWPVTFHCHP